MPKLEPLASGYYIWKYVPSMAASVIFVILFALTTIAYSWKVYKGARFCLAMAIGYLFEVIGYAARAAAYNDTGSLMPYAIQGTFILLGPALFAATIYMTLKRVILSVDGASYSLVPVRWLTRIFVSGDILSFIVQGSGSGLMATGTNSMTTGENIVVGGLIIQVVMFGLFAITAGIFHVRMKKNPTPEALTSKAWERTMHMLYGSSAMIMARSIFRVIEFSMGFDGYPLVHEWTLYVFDALLMFIVAIIFWLWFPQGLQHKRAPSNDTEISMESVPQETRRSPRHSRSYE